MQPLNIERINSVAPYKVWSNGKSFFFDTLYGVNLRLDFDEDKDSLSTVSYWFNIINLNDTPSPHDENVMPTIWTVVEEFFRVNPDVLIYVCDSANEQQAIRARLFKRWFNLYNGHDRFFFCQAEIPDEGVINYVSLIVPKQHPLVNDIVSEFYLQVEMFKQKPSTTR